MKTELATKSVISILSAVLISCASGSHPKESVNPNEHNTSETVQGKPNLVVNEKYVSTSCDAAVKSWIAYGLAKAHIADQKNIAFKDEYIARFLLVAMWKKYHVEEAGSQDEYLSTLEMVNDDGFLEEYVWIYLYNPIWGEPAPKLELEKFKQYKNAKLPHHNVQTQVVILN